MMLIPISASLIESVYTIEDFRNLQDFLLARETPDLIDKDYNFNDDNV